MGGAFVVPTVPTIVAVRMGCGEGSSFYVRWIGRNETINNLVFIGGMKKRRARGEGGGGHVVPTVMAV